MGLAPGEVIQIGLEYLGSAGQPTEYTEFMISALEFTIKETMGLERTFSTPTDTGCSTPDMVLGEWISEYIGISGARITIFCNATQQWRATWLFKDGSGSTSNLLEKQSPIGHRFDEVDNAFGEYYVIDSRGNLQIGDRDGIFTTAKKAGG